MSEVLVREENKQMRILSAVGMILVVAGHLGYSLFDVGGLFPYYSFHIFIFFCLFPVISTGRRRSSICYAILAESAKTLLLPLFHLESDLWNSGSASASRRLFRSEAISPLWNLFIEPFVSGHQFLYQFPAWFVPALFLIEILNVLGRKVLSLLHLKKEWLIFIVCLLLGIATVALAREDMSGAVINSREDSFS